MPSDSPWKPGSLHLSAARRAGAGSPLPPSAVDLPDAPDAPDTPPPVLSDEQLARRLELLNSQLVMYARDFRRLVDSEQKKTLELMELKRQLEDARERLTAIGADVPHDEALADRNGAPLIIGHAPGIAKALALCARVAPTNTTVLLTGETGTGKELTARRIHALSPRAGQAFIAINCAALPEALLESELFGHEKGAFTGAVTTKIGLFELAHGGSLLLDEVGEMPLSLQVKLLRALEERRFRRIGATSEVEVDVRVIAATNRDLKQEVNQNHFRADLYYRLNVFPIHLPALRQRAEDIPLLIGHFLAQHTPAGRVTPRLTDTALSALLAYSWPGNIRELRNVVERAVLLANEDEITLANLPPEIAEAALPPTAELPPELSPDLERAAHTPAPGTPRPAAPVAPTTLLPTHKNSKLAAHERALIIQALDANHWNKAAAARQLGISWDNLRYRIKKYRLQPPPDHAPETLPGSSGDSA